MNRILSDMGDQTMSSSHPLLLKTASHGQKQEASFPEACQSKPVPKLEIGRLSKKRAPHLGALERHGSNISFNKERSSESNTAMQEQTMNSFSLTEQNQYRLNSSSPAHPNLGGKADFKHSAQLGLKLQIA